MDFPSINANYFNTSFNFQETALRLFQYQFHNNPLYQQFALALGKNTDNVTQLNEIPFLPISFFQSHIVKTGIGENWEKIYESSGTTSTQTSKHYIKDEQLYLDNAVNGFEENFGSAENWVILALLPTYVERNNSSLIAMVNKIMDKSAHPDNQYFLNDYPALFNQIEQLEKRKQPTLLIGVTFALIEFATQFPTPLNYTKIMETGGMKGRGEEWTKSKLHQFLGNQFGTHTIYSEYGMTELGSQAYSKGKGIYTPIGTLKALVTDPQDPLSVSNTGSGKLNFIDLANVHSCAFIATDDLGTVYENGDFEVLGRADHSILRGCSLMTT